MTDETAGEAGPSGLRSDGKDALGASIRGIVESWYDGDPPELRPPTLAVVDALGRPADPEIAKELVNLLTRYPRFAPDLSLAARDGLLLEMVAASDGHAIPFEIALSVVTLGVDAARSLVEHAGARTFGGDDLRGVEILLSYLLDHPDGRSATLAALARWPERPDLVAIKEYVSPQLDPAERRKARISTDVT